VYRLGEQCLGRPLLSVNSTTAIGQDGARRVSIMTGLLAQTQKTGSWRSGRTAVWIDRPVRLEGGNSDKPLCRVRTYCRHGGYEIRPGGPNNASPIARELYPRKEDCGGTTPTRTQQDTACTFGSSVIGSGPTPES
jgi:hypothetical protein